MTERENFYEAYRHGKPEWTPNLFYTYFGCAPSCVNNKGVPGAGGKDFFGVDWICTEDTGFQPTPNPRYHAIDMDDFCDWRDYITFPDVDSFDWEGAVKRDLANFNRDDQILEMVAMEGNLNRLQSIVGVAEAFMLLLEEPEACMDFFQAHTDFTRAINERMMEYYKPDIVIVPDDFASEDGLMISRDLYHEFLYGFECDMTQDIIRRGIIAEHHICGFVEPVIDDIVKSGATMWATAQPMNDLAAIQKKYGDVLMLNGGWNSSGPHNFDTATEEIVRAESRRCIDSYLNGGFYSMMPVMIGKEDNPLFTRRCQWAADECKNYSREMLKKLR